MTAPLVRVDDLHVDFTRHGRTIQAVRGVSFEINAGECFAIVGESGSGKSVSARSLVGLAGPGSHVRAEALAVQGRDLLSFRSADWRALRGRDIGFILQDALVSLDPLRTVGQEVGELLRRHKIVPRSEIRSRVEEMLSLAGIPDPAVRADQYPYELSGGLRQRALIASAIGGNPALIVADEPTTALDVTVQEQILDLLERLCGDGTALLLVSHDLAVVARLAQRVAVMQDGVIVETGTTEEVLGNPQHDYTKRLLAAVPSAHPRGARLSAGPTTIAPLEVDTGGLQDERETTIISARDLVKVYPTPGGGRRTAVDGVSFELTHGQSLGIVGESGSGKTTVARLALGLVNPDSGDVHLRGALWSGVSERNRRASRTDIQVISQDALGSFDPRYDVSRIIGEVLHAVGVPRLERRARSIEMLEQVGLDESHLGRFPLQLSGGQRQRVAIARALAARPSVIVCDEPVSALDISIQAQVLDLLADLKNRLGVALLFISHDLGVVRHVCDDVLVMKDGRIVESGSIDDVFTDPRHPYTRALLDALPRLPDYSMITTKGTP
jgi:peptide/nickel transport system ATP-binding protein